MEGVPTIQYRQSFVQIEGVITPKYPNSDLVKAANVDDQVRIERLLNTGVKFYRNSGRFEEGRPTTAEKFCIAGFLMARYAQQLRSGIADSHQTLSDEETFDVLLEYVLLSFHSELVGDGMFDGEIISNNVIAMNDAMKMLGLAPLILVELPDDSELKNEVS